MNHFLRFSNCVGGWVLAVTHTVVWCAPAASNDAESLVRQFAVGMAPTGLPGLRVQVEVPPNPQRWRLGPCERVQPYLPANQKPWGRTRIGLRCQSGPSQWDITLPVWVRVFSAGPVLRQPLPIGATLSPEHLTTGEVEWTHQPAVPEAGTGSLIGGRLARALPSGAPVSTADLQPRRWFEAGARVRLTVRGDGWMAASEGTALGPGLDGRQVRVKTDSGRVLIGRAFASGTVEIDA